MRKRLGLSVLLACLCLVTLPGGALARVSSSFVGVNIEGPFFYPDFPQSAQMQLMHSDGIGSVRELFDWAAMQPYESYAQLPSGQALLYTNVGGCRRTSEPPTTSSPSPPRTT